MTAAIYYEDEYVTEYVDGTETVRFSDDEWAAMMRDPVYFGYSCRAGHRIREDGPFVIAEGCPKCFAANEAGVEPPPPSFPLIRCGHCSGRHVGVGAVYRCGRES
jgi:hypothetical protein